MADECTHLDQIRISSVNQPGCQDCLASGGTWVELRLCVECGRVGCCDNSPNRHATGHFHWWFCYVDELSFEIEGAEPARAAG
jgi:Zn-finger in ubiquitin-hydrolases and other protein